MAVSIEFRANKYLLKHTKNYFPIEENELKEIINEINPVEGERVFSFYQPNDSAFKERIIISNYALYYENKGEWPVIPYKEIKKVGMIPMSRKTWKEYLIISLENGTTVKLPIRGKSKYQEFGQDLEFRDISAFYSFLISVIRYLKPKKETDLQS